MSGCEGRPGIALRAELLNSYDGTVCSVINPIYLTTARARVCVCASACARVCVCNDLQISFCNNATDLSSANSKRDDRRTYVVLRACEERRVAQQGRRFAYVGKSRPVRPALPDHVTLPIDRG